MDDSKPEALHPPPTGRTGPFDCDCRCSRLTWDDGTVLWASQAELEAYGWEDIFGP